MSYLSFIFVFPTETESKWSNERTPDQLSSPPHTHARTNAHSFSLALKRVEASSFYDPPVGPLARLVGCLDRSRNRLGNVERKSERRRRRRRRQSTVVAESGPLLCWYGYKNLLNPRALLVHTYRHVRNTRWYVDCCPSMEYVTRFQGLPFEDYEVVTGRYCAVMQWNRRSLEQKLLSSVATTTIDRNAGQMFVQ